MRKVSVRCAAANDDEDDDDEDNVFVSRVPKRPREGKAAGSSSAAASSEQHSPIKKKKEKEFAWMESDDEDDAEPSGKRKDADAAASSKKKEFAWMESDDEDDAKDNAKPSGEQTRDAVAEDEATLENLEAVQSFGRMMLLMESLHDKLKARSLGAEEVAAACRALGRAKFFDGELLESLSSHLRAMIFSDKLSAEQVSDVMTCFWELNYYKKDVFSAVAKIFKSEIHQANLGPMDRGTWLEVMRALNHETDLDFMQLLEVPPLPPTNPSYRRIKCQFFARGNCALGEVCTWAHSDKAPLSLDMGGNEDAWRKRSVIMTHCQKYVFKEKDVMLGGLLAQKRKDAAGGLG